MALKDNIIAVLQAHGIAHDPEDSAAVLSDLLPKAPAQEGAGDAPAEQGSKFAPPAPVKAVDESDKGVRVVKNKREFKDFLKLYKTKNPTAFATGEIKRDEHGNPDSEGQSDHERQLAALPD